MIVLDNTILDVPIPTISRQLEPTAAQLQWMVDAYTLVFAGLLLTAGSLGDRFGRRGAPKLDPIGAVLSIVGLTALLYGIIEGSQNGWTDPVILASRRLALMALGQGLVMAPATEAIIGSPPLAKAGAGSAVNDMTRQVGGALGVAVIGSVMSSI